MFMNIFLRRMVIGWFNELLSCHCNYPHKDDSNSDEKTKIKSVGMQKATAHKVELLSPYNQEA